MIECHLHSELAFKQIQIPLEKRIGMLHISQHVLGLLLIQQLANLVLQPELLGTLFRNTFDLLFRPPL